jgi:hypothetical protein
MAGDKALRTEKELGPDSRLLLLGVNEMRAGYFLNLQTVLDDGKLSPLSDPLKPKFETSVNLTGWGKLVEPLTVIREQHWSDDKKQLFLDMECVKDDQGQLVPHGRRRTWARNGLPISDLQYQRGLLDGVQRYFDNFNGGKLMSLCFLLEGKEVSRADYEKVKGPCPLNPEEENFLKGKK